MTVLFIVADLEQLLLKCWAALISEVLEVWINTLSFLLSVAAEKRCGCPACAMCDSVNLLTPSPLSC